MEYLPIDIPQNIILIIPDIDRASEIKYVTQGSKINIDDS